MRRLKERRTTGNIDLKEIERKAWTSFYQDGLWELALGLAMLIIWIDGITQDRLGWVMPVAMFADWGPTS